MRRRAAVTLVATAGVVIALGVPAAQAGSPALSCGDTITINTTLTADLGPCPDVGLNINANAITLDLNGHTISGDGSGSFSYGILSTSNSNVVIDSTGGKGTVKNFEAGVFINGGGSNVVRHLRVINNVGSVASGQGAGIIVASEVGDVVEKNIVARNGPFEGIAVFNGADNLIAHNDVHDNVVDDGGVSPYGIRVAVAEGTRIEKNNVLDSGFDGIGVAGPHTRVTDNTVSGSGATVSFGSGIQLMEGANRSRILDNTVSNSALHGIVLDLNARRIRVIGNASIPNGGFDLFDGNTNCDHNTWSLNVFGTADPACAGS